MPQPLRQSPPLQLHRHRRKLPRSRHHRSRQPNPGRRPSDGWRYGQGICYDLRFPEIFRAQQPFDVLLLPAAFTYTTGKAHWQTLLQARAIENQCYVIAAAQGGLHDSGRRTYGHSMIIDPWGEVLAELPEDEGWIIAELNPQRLHSVRNQLPALQHRRF